MTNQLGGILANQEFKLTNTETGWTQIQNTDSDGKWIDHLPLGDWIISIDSVTNSEGVTETLRATLSPSYDQSSTNLSFSTLESALAVINLTEGSGEVLEGMSIMAHSEEGLGTVELEPTDSDGSTIASIFPGDWTLSLDSEDSGVKQVLSDTSVEFVSGDNGELNFTSERLAKVGGSVFWDLNDDSEYNIGEGLFNASISITDGSCMDSSMPVSSEYEIQYSDISGSWSVYLVANMDYCVDVSAEGFDDMNMSIELLDDPIDSDSSMTAQLVDVGGQISYIDETQFSLISDSLLVELIPTDEYVRDSVQPVKTIVDGSWHGNWSASVEPGNWIVRVSSEEHGLVSMSLIDAEVIDGGFTDSDLVTGGWALIDTQWFDYEGISRTLSDVDDPKLIMNLGMGISWVPELDDEGSTRLLLPGGVIDVSSEFTSLQRGLNMTYSGGQAVGVEAGQETPIITVSHSRIPFREISLTVLQGTGGDPTHSAGEDDMLALMDNDTMSFSPVEFVISADYLGHEPLDTFSAQATVPGTDGSDWLVEFHNGSGEWNSSMSFDMGLDGEMSLEDLNVRVTPPNQTVAHSLTGGHNVKISFFTSDGYFEETSVKVRIPQIHGFSVTSLEPVYGVSPGEEIQIPMEIRNDGNGDDRFEFVFDDSELPDGWERTGSTSHTVPPFTATTHSVTVSAPEDASGEYTIYVSVMDKEGNTYPDVEILVRVSNPIVSIVTHAFLRVAKMRCQRESTPGSLRSRTRGLLMQ